MEEIWADLFLHLPTGRLEPPARSGHHSDGQMSLPPSPCPGQHCALLRDLCLKADEYLQRLARIFPQDPREKREESGEGADHKPAGRKETQRGRQLRTARRCSGTHLLQGGIGERLREIETFRPLGRQQRKEAQDCEGPRQRHAKTRIRQTDGWRGQ